MSKKCDSRWHIILSLPIYTAIMFAGYLFFSATSPVVTDFAVTKQSSYNHHLRVEGVFRKARNCKFESLHITSNITGVPRRHNYTFEDVEGHAVGSSRGKGLQAFGPWKIYAGRDQRPLMVSALHLCDMGLYTATFLGVIE